MDKYSTEELKQELMRRAQSRPGMQELDPRTLGLRKAAPPAALQGFRFEDITENSLTLSAPLEHTWNGAGIAFAGSLATFCAITGAQLCSHACAQAGYPTANAFCHTASIQYKNKVVDEFYKAHATISQEGLQKFRQEMKDVGKARVQAMVQVISEGQVCVQFEGSWTCNDPNRSKRGDVRYSKYDSRPTQGGGGSSAAKL